MFLLFFVCVYINYCKTNLEIMLAVRKSADIFFNVLMRMLTVLNKLQPFF